MNTISTTLPEVATLAYNKVAARVAPRVNQLCESEAVQGLNARVNTFITKFDLPHRGGPALAAVASLALAFTPTLVGVLTAVGIHEGLGYNERLESDKGHALKLAVVATATTLAAKVLSRIALPGLFSPIGAAAAAFTGLIVGSFYHNEIRGIAAKVAEEVGAGDDAALDGAGDDEHKQEAPAK